MSAQPIKSNQGAKHHQEYMQDEMMYLEKFQRMDLKQEGRLGQDKLQGEGDGQRLQQQQQQQQQSSGSDNDIDNTDEQSIMQIRSRAAYGIDLEFFKKQQIKYLHMSCRFVFILFGFVVLVVVLGYEVYTLKGWRFDGARGKMDDVDRIEIQNKLNETIKQSQSQSKLQYKPHQSKPEPQSQPQLQSLQIQTPISTVPVTPLPSSQSNLPPATVSTPPNPPIPPPTRSQSLQSLSNPGLTSYYQSIQTHLRIIHIRFPSGYRNMPPSQIPEGIYLYSYVVDGLGAQDADCGGANRERCVAVVQGVVRRDPRVMDVVVMVGVGGGDGSGSAQKGKNSGYYTILMEVLEQGAYNYQTQVVQIQPDYGFINKYISMNSQWIVYTKWNFLIQQIRIQNIPSVGPKTKQKNYAYIVPSATPPTPSNPPNTTTTTLQPLLQSLQHNLLIFNTSLLSLVTPTNLAYQNLYTMLEILVWPVVVLAWEAGRLGYGYGQGLGQGQGRRAAIAKFEVGVEIGNGRSGMREFQIKQGQRGDDKSRRQIFFVSFGTFINVNRSVYLSQLNKYLQNILSQVSQNITKEFSLKFIISTPTSFSQTFTLEPSPIAAELFHTTVTKILNFQLQNPQKHNNKNIQIRLRLRPLDKLSPALEVYEAVNTYCEQSGVMFVSRFNVIPELQAVLGSVSRAGLCTQGGEGGNGSSLNRKLMIIGNYIINSTPTDLNPPTFPIPSLSSTLRPQSLTYYPTHLSHAQIFCQQLASQLRIETFKWQQLSFYYSQASYAVPLLERVRDGALWMEKEVLYRIEWGRGKGPEWEREGREFEGLRFRDAKKTIAQKPIKVMQYSQLNNQAYKNNPSPQIPPILHQIWLSPSPRISPIRLSLQSTLLRTNPTFTYYLWTNAHLTPSHFPITYDCIVKVQDLSKRLKINYNALIADLMRIEILYRFGGIYVDMKVEGKRDLTPFLKYQQFYFYVEEGNCVNGLIGSSQGNRYLKIILQEFFKPEFMKRPKQHIYQLTGGTKLAQAYTPKQIYTQVLSFGQFIYQGPRPCVINTQNSQRKPDSDQQVFEGISGFRDQKPYKVLIPCKLDMQKYLEIYDILGRSYFPGAQEFS